MTGERPRGPVPRGRPRNPDLRFLRELRWLFKSPGKFFRGLLGVFMMIIAAIALALPVVPQVPFFLGGLVFLGSVSPRTRLLRMRLLRTRLGRKVRGWLDRRAARRRGRGR